MNLDDLQIWIEDHPLAVAGTAVAVAGGVLFLSRKRKQDAEETTTPAVPVGRLLDAYPPSVMMSGSGGPVQLLTIRSGSPGSPVPMAGSVSESGRRFTGIPGISCPRGSKLKQRSDGSWTCVSDRTGREIPIRERTAEGWRPVI